MTTLRAPIIVLILWATLTLARAQSTNWVEIDVRSDGNQVFQLATGEGMASNNVRAVITYTNEGRSSNAVVTADKVSWDTNTGEVFAEGSVRIQTSTEILAGETLHINYFTRQMAWTNFRAGEMPYFAEGTSMETVGTNGENIGGWGRDIYRIFNPSVDRPTTNTEYVVNHAAVTTDDYSDPFEFIRASEIKMVPGQYIEARDATVYLDGVPVAYFPYLHRSLTHNPDHFSFLPGYSGEFGAYLLSSYDWTLNSNLSGAVHADFRARRGFGTGPDFDYQLGRWGEGTIKYYFTHDEDPGEDPTLTSNTPPATRQRAYFSYYAEPFTNLTLLSQVAYQTDPYIIRDFFESEYEKDIQPNTFFDGDKEWNNWSLDLLAQPRVDPFFETVERLPEVKLTGFRQQIFDTPLYYESQSSAGYYDRLFANTNLTQSNFDGGRADTFQQITMPETLFGWLNLTPRVGGRFTYYSSASGPGATTSNEDRWVFNTGAEISTKASQTWPGLTSSLLDMDGLRHIIIPSIDYQYVPRPNVEPSQLPQFDYELTNTLRMLPLEFPYYDSIDSIDRENTMRFGINNLLQTKRKGAIDDLLTWDVETDWNLRPRTNQTTFSDIFSDIAFKPRPWLTIISDTRYDIESGRFNLAQDSITFQPNTTWSWSVGNFFLRDNTNSWGLGDDLFTSTLFYRFDQNWGVRLGHYFDAKTGTLEEQDYTIYRDMRSWTAALTFRDLNNGPNGHEFAVAATFSFKAFPRFKEGQDTVSASSLIGY